MLGKYKYYATIYIHIITAYSNNYKIVEMRRCVYIMEEVEK